MTVEYKGVELEVEYDYQPEEACVMYYSDGSGYPGCAEQIDITEITINGVDVFELLENDLEEIEELISNKIHEQ